MQFELYHTLFTDSLGRAAQREKKRDSPFAAPLKQLFKRRAWIAWRSGTCVAAECVERHYSHTRALRLGSTCEGMREDAAETISDSWRMDSVFLETR